MWSNARLTTYITGLVGFGGLTLAGAGLVVDGISGPKTRAALHEALLGIRREPLPELSNRPGTAPQKPAAPKAAPAQPKPATGLLALSLRALAAIIGLRR